MFISSSGASQAISKHQLLIHVATDAIGRPIKWQWKAGVATCGPFRAAIRLEQSSYRTTHLAHAMTQPVLSGVDGHSLGIDAGSLPPTRPNTQHHNTRVGLPSVHTHYLAGTHTHTHTPTNTHTRCLSVWQPLMANPCQMSSCSLMRQVHRFIMCESGASTPTKVDGHGVARSYCGLGVHSPQ